MTDRLQLPRLLDIYAANWTLLLEARDRKLVAMLRSDFDAIHQAQCVELPQATALLMDLLVAHETLADKVNAGATAAELAPARQAHEAALAALRVLAGSAVG